MDIYSKLLEPAEATAKGLRDFYKSLGTPEGVQFLVEAIVEAYTENRTHSAEMGLLRNQAIKDVVNALNELQKGKDAPVFQRRYEVTLGEK